MAIKKSELYSSLWASCDELRGSMDASQYKDYVLVLLFMKYVSDKVKKELAEGKTPVIEMPKGKEVSFYDMLKYRGKSDVGDKINKVIGEFAKANSLSGIITEADFNDDAKLGSGKEKVDLLTNLLNIFNRPELDFSKNKAEGDDLLGDAYEYLMRHFATESGKSKGQFYTPSEVSRIMAQIIGIDKSKSQSETLYDPTCGSGSLLLKSADIAPHGITIYGQENDNATRALAVMNMWLHNFADADIRQGNTMADPKFTDDKTGKLKTFDYAVSNPPFSYKKWMNGLVPDKDVYKRFEGYAIPPRKNGDYAFLLHLIKSLKSKGKACIVMPLGVLFRGNSEAEIRKRIIKQGYIKAIIALPPNLFYGTGIAACLMIIDKEGAKDRKSIFMIDASRGFKKDGNKNRLRERDIHKIVDTFKNKITTDPKYARDIPLSEIKGPKNDYNLNIPRYIDSQDPEDIQDIEAHLLGGIPLADIEALKIYWDVYPSLKKALFKPIKNRKNYVQLLEEKENIKDAIFQHTEFVQYDLEMQKVFKEWRTKTIRHCRKLDKGLYPKREIHYLSESLLKQYAGKALTDQYSMYQYIMEYWEEIMQDDLYEIAADGWKAGKEVKRLERKTKKGEKETVKAIIGIEGLEGRLIPPALLIQEYFSEEQEAIHQLESDIETVKAKIEEIIEVKSSEEGLLDEVSDDKGKVNKTAVQKRFKVISPQKDKKTEEEYEEEYEVLELLYMLYAEEADKTAQLKNAKTKLEQKIISKYPKLTIKEIQYIVIEQKWMATIELHIQNEMNNISHRLAQRIKELAERYEYTLPQLTNDLDGFTKKVEAHLKKMDYTW
ncbi:type I restriction-modification system subunit M [Arachidicoccus ginsenosidivorans]